MTTQTEIDITARTAWAEDRSGMQDGITAVCDVIANRVASARVYMQRHNKPHPLFGDGTFADCCKRPKQFSCWNIDDPNYSKLLRVNTTDPAFALAVKIATLAVNGALIDTTDAATYYYAKSEKQIPAWAKGKTPCAEIGGQLFFNSVT